MQFISHSTAGLSIFFGIAVAEDKTKAVSSHKGHAF
jgi:hypothetical protein